MMVPSEHLTTIRHPSPGLVSTVSITTPKTAGLLPAESEARLLRRPPAIESSPKHPCFGQGGPSSSNQTFPPLCRTRKTAASHIRHDVGRQKSSSRYGQTVWVGRTSLR